MASYLAGLALSWERLNARWLSVASFSALLLTLLGLLVEHRAEPSSSADTTLQAVTFGIVIPLLILAAVGRAFPMGLDRGIAPITRHGGDRRVAALGASTVVIGFSVTASAVLAVLTRVLGGSSSNPSVSDAVTCAWIGALAGICYGFLFVFGATFGKRGQGRWIALIIDWVLGVGSGVLALPWPRANLRNLLGGVPAADLQQGYASAVLGALVLIYGVLTLLRTPR